MALKNSYTDENGQVYPDACLDAYVMDMPKDNGQRLVSVQYNIFSDSTMTELVGTPRFQFPADDTLPIYPWVDSYVVARGAEVVTAKGVMDNAQATYDTADTDLLAAQALRSTLTDEEGNQLEGYDAAREDELEKLEVFNSAKEVLKQSEVDYNALVPYELFTGATDV